MKTTFLEKIINELASLKSIVDIIVDNRISEELKDSLDKIYIRDLSGSDY